MHPSRRRKKRPNYGIKTVEVIRGPNGFGFTISGQQPCILSCIVANSPADQAGLRAGDFLISVNGVSVSKITHDAVVNLIGNCVSPIRMTIAENYYSDSSDEELEMGRMVSTRKPKYMHKPRTHRSQKSEARGAMCVDSKRMGKPPLWHDNNLHEDVASNIAQSVNTNAIPMEDEAGPVEYKVLVGYLGTIEMPKQLLPNSRLQTVCSCIRKLRQEKRTPTAILITVLPTCLTLKNASNQILAIYPMNRVVYISSTTDKESRYFGLVTSAISDSRGEDNFRNKAAVNVTDNLQKRHDYSLNIWQSEEEKKKCNLQEKDVEMDISNSCHVFITDPKIVDHGVHSKKAETFSITCTADLVTGNCMEFPKNALGIVSYVQNMYRLQETQKNDEGVAPILANSPQPSTSSNSDSGIGFRDDCGNVSDRILVVEFPSHRPFPILNSNNHRPSDVSKMPVETLAVPLNNDMLNNLRKNYERNDKLSSNLNNIRAYEKVTIKNVIEKTDSFNRNDYLAKQNNKPDSMQAESVKRLAVRAMPDLANSKTARIVSPNPDSFSERAVDVPDESPGKKSCESVSLHSMTEDYSDFKGSVDNMSIYSSRSVDLKAVFKTPSTKYLENRKSTKRQLKMIGSCDNLVPNKHEESVLNYKLSPKVYGVSKPNHSCEELNNLENVEVCGYGSLQELCRWGGKKSTARNIAQSEPDVRMQRSGRDRETCEKRDVAKCNGSESPAGWANSFEKLLDDPLGLHTFAEFLKKEFSAENIYFWTACERYRHLPAGPERAAEAQRIYRQHLCIGAPEPVNVDCQGRQCTEQSLHEADNSLFDLAQKQIFNLMKFDSYPRFLKSDLYKQVLSGNIDGPRLDMSLLLQPPTSTSPSKLKKSLSNAEDRRRKSLLPWHRKNRSKSKDRGESEYNQRKTDEAAEEEQSGYSGIKNGTVDMYNSKSSLTSLDLAITSSMQDSMRGSQDDINARGPLCRVILNNGTTTIVQIRNSETIQQFINRLLEKRGLSYTSFEVFTDKHHKSLDLNDPSSKLAGCEVTVEQRVVFKLDLPNRKIIAVKSKYTKVLGDVLRPILHKYNYSMEQVRVTHNNEDVDVTLRVTSVDGLRLNVQLLEVFVQKDPPVIKINSAKVSNSTLDEITNKVYEDILQEKSETACFKPKSDKGSVKSEDWGSEHSSGIFGRFLRRDSAMHERKKKNVLGRKGNSSHGSTEDIGGEPSNNAYKKPLIAKWKSGVKLHYACSESDELYEGLSRAQRSRLEDQRGTEINFELPDFLKDKENDFCNKNYMKSSGRLQDNYPESTHFYSRDGATQRLTNPVKSRKLETPVSYENTNMISSENGMSRVAINNNNSASHRSSPSVLNNLRIYSPNKFSSDENVRSPQSSTSKSLENTVIENKSDSSLKNCGEPPPLPPKPKVLPIKPSNWGQNSFPKTKESVLSVERKQTLFLEQPTSSFV